jgi:hypothetical protein
MATSSDTIDRTVLRNRPVDACAAAVRRRLGRRAVWPGALAAVALGVAAAINAGSAAAGPFGSVELVTRADGRVLPVYEKDGRRWVVGTPGAEYAIRVCNTTGARVLAVMSVDGVNVVSGDTASPSQAGYVLDARECTDINGWRKNLSSVAAFYFTELPDSYAARTGRPDNVGVIGVAFFRERPQPMVWKDVPKFAARPSGAPAPRQEAAGGNGAAAEGRADAAPAAQRDRLAAEGRADAAAEAQVDSASAARKSQSEVASAAPLPTPLGKIGTGHGAEERSVVQTTRFERESATPNETVAILYDRRENLIAMGILPRPSVARSANPFPAWTPRFVPDPPAR